MEAGADEGAEEVVVAAAALEGAVDTEGQTTEAGVPVLVAAAVGVDDGSRTHASFLFVYFVILFRGGVVMQWAHAMRQT